jgi:hypothetical protein
VFYWFVACILIYWYRRAMPLYIPVHLLGFVLGQKHSFAMLAENLIRSCGFLSLYCGSAWFTACIFYRFAPFVTKVTRTNLNLALALGPGRRDLFFLQLSRVSLFFS